MNFVSVDGGGTKLNAIWFDEKLNLLGRARALGVNSTITPREEYRAHIRSCFDALFDGHAPKVIDELFVICGSGPDYADCLPEGTALSKMNSLAEIHGGLLAGRGLRDGILVIAGTGSNIHLCKNGQTTDYVGGLGAILGDEGSGVWMARQAAQAAVRCGFGWGERTLFTDMLIHRLHLKNIAGLVNYLYDSPSPFQRLGLLLPLAGEAARAGDRALLEVFARGGEMLARQTLALIDRHPEFRGSIVICGGAWKAHPATFERFSAIVGEKHPSLPICRPWFEHVLAGPMDMLLRMGFAPEDAHARLLETFPDYEWRA